MKAGLSIAILQKPWRSHRENERYQIVSQVDQIAFFDCSIVKRDGISWRAEYNGPRGDCSEAAGFVSKIQLP